MLEVAPTVKAYSFLMKNIFDNVGGPVSSSYIERAEELIAHKRLSKNEIEWDLPASHFEGSIMFIYSF